MEMVTGDAQSTESNGVGSDGADSVAVGRESVVFWAGRFASTVGRLLAIEEIV